MYANGGPLKGGQLSSMGGGGTNAPSRLPPKRNPEKGAKLKVTFLEDIFMIEFRLRSGFLKWYIALIRMQIPLYVLVLCIPINRQRPLALHQFMHMIKSVTQNFHLFLAKSCRITILEATEGCSVVVIDYLKRMPFNLYRS